MIGSVFSIAIYLQALDGLNAPVDVAAVENWPKHVRKFKALYLLAMP